MSWHIRVVVRAGAETSPGIKAGTWKDVGYIKPVKFYAPAGNKTVSGVEAGETGIPPRDKPVSWTRIGRYSIFEE